MNMLEPIRAKAETGASRLRVLIIAEAANPEWVSVPLVGWMHCRALAKLVDAHIVTQVRNRPALLRAGLVEGKEFTAMDSEGTAKWLCRIGKIVRCGRGRGWTAVSAMQTLAYYFFELKVWHHFKADIQGRRYDIVHRLTPLSATSPSIIAKKCRKAGVPFVIGPLNGGLGWPKKHLLTRLREREMLSFIRSGYKLLPGYRGTRDNAAALILGSKSSWDQMPARYHNKSFYLVENGVNTEEYHPGGTLSSELPLKVLFIGRLVPYKGADIVVEAASQLLKEGKVTLEIIGDGPERHRIEKLIKRAGVGESVKLCGWLKHGEIRERLSEAAILAFPSVREFGGGVVLEAMAMGVVPIVVDYGGPSELVDIDSGYLLDLSSREQLCLQLRAALREIAQGPEVLEGKRMRCIEQVHERYTWDVKARRVVEIYNWTLGRGVKPAVNLPSRSLALGCASASKVGGKWDH